jgi:two-component system sensor histidine kinase DesK
VAALFTTQLLVMWSAVTPWASVTLHRRSQVLFAVAAILSVPLVAPVAADRWATWAWVGASVIGTAPVVWRWSTTALLALLLTVTSLAVALVLGGDWVKYVVITLGVGGGLALVNWAPVLLWELLLRADATQQAGVRAAAARERNRFGRDVHDILGHDLTVIALKSELAARTAATDPVSAARESEEVRAVAESALGRIRGALAVRRDVDVRAEIDQMARILSAAGLRTDVATRPVRLSPQAADVLSMVVKEATTNVLRHSDATWCRVRLDSEAEGVRLAILNDRPRPGQPSTGSGLTGLRERLAAVRGELSVQREGDFFLLTVRVPAGDD